MLKIGWDVELASLGRSTMDPRVPKTLDEIERRHHEQLRMLASRCDAFYDGDHHEALSMAAIVSNLVYDHGQSAKSLLSMLDLKTSTRFLDSRTHNNLTLATARGVWPRTPMPYKEYTGSDLYGFDTWWSEQEFQIKFVDLVFTRSDLVKALRDREGGAHVDPNSDYRIAAIERSQSQWRSNITTNEDGSQAMEVVFHLGDPAEIDELTAGTEINGFVLASMCAIAEELLFSLTAEPENRNRMQSEALRRPLYLTETEIGVARLSLRIDLERLRELSRGDLDTRQEIGIEIATRQIEWALAQEPITNAELEVQRLVPESLRSAGIDWP